MTPHVASNAPTLEQEQSHVHTAELLARHRAGDANALQRLIELYYPRIERIVRVRLGAVLLARETVADVVQDVLVRIVEGLEGYEERDDASWINWVARLAQNEIASHARRERAQKRGGPVAAAVRSHAQSVTTWSVADDTASVGAKVAQRELFELADRCLSELPEAQREVILLRDYAGMDWKSITERMDRPSVGASQELHRRAHRELRERLQGRV